MKRKIAFGLLFALGSFFLVESAEARPYRSWRRSNYSFGGARPATGYGSNIHRNFILKQEARRASQGKRVRNRGNILWFR